MKEHPSFLVLAIEARRRRFGYALFEGPKHLLDWGTSVIPAGFSPRETLAVARKRLTSVLRRGSPAAIVVARPQRKKTRLNGSAGPMFGLILREAETLNVRVHSVSRDEMRMTFRFFRARSKEQVASALIGLFPELICRLPRKRRKWQPERRGMIVFDAIVAGLAYWFREGAELTSPE